MRRRGAGWGCDDDWEDGNPDLAFPNQANDTVSVLLGEGDGSFQAAVDYGTGDAPTSVLLGDLNRDGTPDLVATNAGSKSFSVLLGQGDGSFASAMTSTATARPIWRWRGTTPAR